MTHHATIVGGGAVGMSLAWELARRGCRVTLIESGRLGRATSWAGAGILPPANSSTAVDPIDQLRGLSHELFPVWSDELREQTAVDIGLRRCGGWYLAETPGEQASMAGMTGYWDEMQIEVEPTSLDALARREPALSDWVRRNQDASACWVPDEYQVRAPRLMRALELACRSRGVTILEDCPVDQTRIQGDRLLVRTRDEWHETDSVTLCAGAWTGQVAADLGFEASVIPVRGQMLLLKTDRPLLKGIVNVGHRYVVCRDDGHTLVGSCEEEVGFDNGTTAEMLDALNAFAVNLVSGLATAPRRGGWSGLRPMTFDGFPMIGRIPDSSNGYVAAGHYRSGLHLAPATAVALAELILEHRSIVNVDAFRVGRHQSHV